MNHDGVDCGDVAAALDDMVVQEGRHRCAVRPWPILDRFCSGAPGSLVGKCCSRSVKEALAMRARDLLAAFPAITLDTPLLEAARLPAERDLPGLIVIDVAGHGRGPPAGRADAAGPAGPDEQPMGVVAWAATATFVVAYALIATEKVHRVAAALGGTGIMPAIHATDAQTAFFDEATGIDWNVIFLLLGMMIIIGSASACRTCGCAA
jgi:hypothetical protein